MTQALAPGAVLSGKVKPSSLHLLSAVAKSNVALKLIFFGTAKVPNSEHRCTGPVGCYTKHSLRGEDAGCKSFKNSILLPMSLVSVYSLYYLNDIIR